MPAATNFHVRSFQSPPPLRPKSVTKRTIGTLRTVLCGSVPNAARALPGEVELRLLGRWCASRARVRRAEHSIDSRVQTMDTVRRAIRRLLIHAARVRPGKAAA